MAFHNSNWKRYVRGYTTHVSQNASGGTAQVFLIDYGFHEDVCVKNLKKLPDFASVDELPAQTWKLAIHGVLPIHVEFEFGAPAKKKYVASVCWYCTNLGADCVFL